MNIRGNFFGARRNSVWGLILHEAITVRDKNIVSTKFMFSWKRVGPRFMKHTGIPKLVLAVVLNGQFRKSTGLVRICSPYLFDWSTFEPLERLIPPRSQKDHTHRKTRG